LTDLGLWHAARTSDFAKKNDRKKTMAQHLLRAWFFSENKE
jgi:hypothetical protein